MKKITDLNITGIKMHEISDSLLNMIGFELNDRLIILKYLKRAISNNKENNNNNYLCCACITNKINTVFIPCGHQSYCDKVQFHHKYLLLWI